MHKIDDIGTAIADMYSRALLSVAKSADAVQSVHDELAAVVEMVNAYPTLESYLTGVTVDRDARRELLEKTFRGKTSDSIVDFLLVLNRRDRLDLLEVVAERYRLRHEELQNEIDAFATTATPLSDAVRQSLIAAIGKFTGKKPVLTERVDESLIAGLVVHVGDQKIDFSVKTRLESFRDRLRDRASREIHAGRAYFQES